VVRTPPCRSRGCCAAVGWWALGSTPPPSGTSLAESQRVGRHKRGRCWTLCSLPAAPPRLLRRRRGCALRRQGAITAPRGGRGKGTASVLWPTAECARGQGTSCVPTLAAAGQSRPWGIAGHAVGPDSIESEGATCGHRPHDHRSRESLPPPSLPPGRAIRLPRAGPTALDACAVPASLPACLCPTWPSGPAHAADHRAACGRGKGPPARAPPRLQSASSQYLGARRRYQGAR